LYRTQAIAPAPEQPCALLLFFRIELRGPHVICARERSEKCRQGRCVIVITPRPEDFDHCFRYAEAGTAEASRTAPRCPLYRFFRARQFRLDLFAGIQMQPRLVMKRMASDFVAGRRNRAEYRGVPLESRVLSDDEESDPE